MKLKRKIATEKKIIVFIWTQTKLVSKWVGASKKNLGVWRTKVSFKVRFWDTVPLWKGQIQYPQKYSSESWQSKFLIKMKKTLLSGCWNVIPSSRYFSSIKSFIGTDFSICWLRQTVLVTHIKPFNHPPCPSTWR